MSEEEMVPVPDSQVPAPRGMRSRVRRFFRHHLPLAAAGIAGLLVLLAMVVYFIASSAAFENVVRKRLIAEIENLTGGRAQIAAFHWRLLHLQAEADGVVVHGLEDPGDAPYAQIDRLRVQVALLGVLSPHVSLRDLEVIQPRLHLIVYPDGSTNQPHPRRPSRPAKSNLDPLFDLQARHIAVEHGELHFDSRATEFDFQNRYAPLDFEANDVTLIMRYLPAAPGAPESYRIEAGAASLNLERNVPRGNALPVRGTLTATVDLERSRILLRSLRLTAHRQGAGEDHALEVAGVMDGLSHTRWQGKAAGDLDMRLLDPIFGYPDAPEGIAHLDLAASGQAEKFQIEGGVHIDGGAYIGAGVTARNVTLDAHVQADAKHLQISQIVARLQQGGRIEGTVALEPWLPAAPAATLERTYAGPEERRANRNTLIRSAPNFVPVNGKVTASFHDVPLDTVLAMVAAPPYRRLGLDALLNGPAQAAWSYGLGSNVGVTALFGLSPSGRTPDGEVPASGVIDASYTQRTGGVTVRRLEVHLPASELEARGSLGAYPPTRSSALIINFRSSDLAEFDSALRSLGFKRNGKTGAAALPVALRGQAKFQGTWTGSLMRPQIEGRLNATQLSIEMPAQDSPQAAPRFMLFDSVGIDGEYSPAMIAIRHAQLLRDGSKIDLSGTLEAPAHSRAGFDENSVLHLHAEASSVDFADLQPFIAEGGATIPVQGRLNAQIQADGPLRTAAGSGWVEFENATVFGEPISHVHLRGALQNRVLKLTSSTVEEAGGVVTATGTYDFADRQFHLDAHAERIEVSRIGWLRQRNLDVTGKLGLSMSGSGTPDDPHLEGQASIGELTLAGQQFGSLDFDAQLANHRVDYKLSTHLEGAELALKGATQLDGGYSTMAQLDFSHFNIGALLAASHLEAFRGESALAGTATVAGPLTHPEQLHGEVRLNELSLTLSGVELKSEGGARATLANNRIQLDPLHVTGNQTDLHIQGGLSLQQARQLDLQANGSINLKLAETLDPDLTASGMTTFQVEAHGPLNDPQLQGRLELENGSLSLGDLPNGLSQLQGSLQFNQNRLEVKSLTAMSGGGLLSVSGFLAYQHGVYADLSASGKGVRIRYPQGVTSLADAKLQLQGSQNSLLLSGDVLITRFTANPDLDLAALAEQASLSMPTIAPPDAPSNHVRLDVHIASSPQLNFQNAYAKLAGDVDVRLHGTLASPSLLGRVSITQGSAMIAGTHYDLERGDITFNNPVRIEPIIDLSATARVEDYDITLNLNGTPQRLSVTYRSDPPLPETDVLSLLALGHTANQQRLYTQQQQESISNPTDALLGGALNATVSNRIQKLFGAGSVKVDPNYLGAFGNSTSRITVQEQLGRDITLTYATDVNTTSQQLLQAEVAINRHVSLVVARDESGVFSMVVKATRRYR
jgi:translocation and assembly module TamB